MVTVIVMGTFFGIVWWAYAPSRKAEWERKGRLDDDPKTGTYHVFPPENNRGTSRISHE